MGCWRVELFTELCMELPIPGDKLLVNLILCIACSKI